MLSIILLLAVPLFSFSQALSQADTNGASTWGILDAPTYSRFLTDNPLPDGYPWGTAKANDSNPYTQAPNTRVTRHSHLTLSRTQKAPDGYLKNVILVNDQLPGPLIEANWGDWIDGVFYR